MATVILDRWLAQHVREERVITGAYRWDEVWDGDCLIMPSRDNEHQALVADLGSIFLETVGWHGREYVLPSTYVSDRADGWEDNYRCPDVAIFLANTAATNCDTHWCGGPDFAVEIVSDDDRSRDKIPFYATAGTRELLVVDRGPWQLELFRLDRSILKSVGVSTISASRPLGSQVMPLTFRLMARDTRPDIEVVYVHGGKKWLV